ncbi:hypothetical protein UFOVP1244_143 [uncultured Caudovirales phage]|uniref:Uncharacterized protein n=1 Tax=uncultured Caudovirales phage TaxID=2100421 RepID=A0A6J5RH91_9CAUD|nr:hypothetical protein UFOVP1244_143 [uncultured Caudovirales phage]
MTVHSDSLLTNLDVVARQRRDLLEEHVEAAGAEAGRDVAPAPELNHDRCRRRADGGPSPVLDRLGIDDLPEAERRALRRVETEAGAVGQGDRGAEEEGGDGEEVHTNTIEDRRRYSLSR